MSGGFDFERLVELCRRTHEETRRAAISAIDASMAACGLAREGQVVEEASDRIKDPAVLEFLGLEADPVYSENDMETAILDRLQQFLLGLEKGFLFGARQKRYGFDDSHFLVDLMFYNRLLRCHVLIDVTPREMTRQDRGQMQMYVNHFDRHLKTEDELPTVGILICYRKNEAVVELTLPEDADIHASKYELYLPSKRELAVQVAMAAICCRGPAHRVEADVA